MSESSKRFYKSINVGLTLVIIIWTVHLIKHFTGASFSHYGIFPRQVYGLVGILASPLIHSGWEHLISNSVPLFVSSTIIHFFYKRVAWSSFFFIYLLTGFFVWLFGRSVFHIGASGVVYGLIAFIFGSGIFRRNIKSIILALIVTILYSGYIAGVLPYQEGISWESHLIGAIMGMIVAFFLKGVIEADEVKRDPWENENDEPQRYFLPRDIFDKTIEERIREQSDQNDNLPL